MGDAVLIPWATLRLDDLQMIAADLEIAGRARMRRHELLQAIRTRAHKNPSVRELVLAKINATGRAGKGNRHASVSRRAKVPPVMEPAPTSPLSPLLPAVIQPTAQPYLDRGKAIPNTYGDDRLLFMVRDPYGGYVYWELDGPVAHRLQLAYGEQLRGFVPWLLRIHSLLTRSSHDVPVDVHACRAYVALQPGQLYAVELGFLEEEDRFTSVLRAGAEHTPRDGMSPVADEMWYVTAGDLAGLVGDYDHAEVRRVSSSSIWQARFTEIAGGGETRE